jgi:hypothetical protein
VRALVVVLLCGLLVSCSSSDKDPYCSLLGKEKPTINKLADEAQAGGSSYLADSLALFGRLRQAAPDDLRDEWDTVYFAWSDLIDIFAQTGIDPSTFTVKKKPEGVSQADFERVKAVAAKLTSSRVLDAVRGINDQAHDACHVDLSL